MYALDFQYDGIFLSSYNCIICDFDWSGGAVVSQFGSPITFNRASRNYGKVWSLTGIEYNECFETSFDICKDPEKDDSKYFTNFEFLRLCKWLRRIDGFHKFTFMSIDTDIPNCYFNASFNIEKILVQDRIVGARLSMVTDSPYGYGKTEEIQINTVGLKYTYYEVEDKSMVIGDICPSLRIVCNKDGDFEIRNETNGTSFTIKGCVSGEIITFDSSIRMIQSSTGRNLWDNFNYKFLNISNSLDSNINKIYISLASNVTITYEPIVLIGY